MLLVFTGWAEMLHLLPHAGQHAQGGPARSPTLLLTEGQVEAHGVCGGGWKVVGEIRSIPSMGSRGWGWGQRPAPELPVLAFGETAWVPTPTPTLMRSGTLFPKRGYTGTLYHCPSCEPAPPPPCEGQEVLGTTRSLPDQAKALSRPFRVSPVAQQGDNHQCSNLGTPSEEEDSSSGLGVQDKGCSSRSPAPPHRSQEQGSAAKHRAAFLLTPPCFLSQVQN